MESSVGRRRRRGHARGRGGALSAPPAARRRACSSGDSGRGRRRWSQGVARASASMTRHVADVHAGAGVPGRALAARARRRVSLGARPGRHGPRARGAGDGEGVSSWSGATPSRTSGPAITCVSSSRPATLDPRSGSIALGADGTSWRERWERLERALVPWGGRRVNVVGDRHVHAADERRRSATSGEILAQDLGRRPGAAGVGHTRPRAAPGVDADELEGRRVRGGCRPGPVHRAPGRRADGEDPRAGDGVPLVGITSLDALAFRCGTPHDDRRGDRRPPRRGLLRSSTGRSRAASCARPSPRWRSPTHLVAELQAIPGDVLAVGDGAILYRRCAPGAGEPGRVRVAGRRPPRGRGAGRAGRAPLPPRGARPALRRRPDVPEEVGC